MALSTRDIIDRMFEPWYEEWFQQQQQQENAEERERVNRERAESDERLERQYRLGPVRWLPSSDGGALYLPNQDEFFLRFESIQYGAGGAGAKEHFRELCGLLSVRQPDGFVESPAIAAHCAGGAAPVKRAKGCYCFLDVRSGVSFPVYIGKAVVLPERLRDHVRRSKWFTDWSKEKWGQKEPFMVAYWFEEQNRAGLESDLISRLQPHYNQHIP